MLIRELCAASGVSGGEDEVRELIASYLPLCRLTVDVMGNLLAENRGKGKKILLASHMDEVGLIISQIDENGFLKFKTVGGINTEVIIGKRVYIGKNKLPGIIGLRAVHLRHNEDEAIKEDKLYIDIGAGSKKEAEEVVALGDYASFEPHFCEFGDRLISCKALDDRAGCAALIEIMNRRYPHNICCAFTGQEEVGCRGAQAAAEYFKPELAVIIETTICADIYPSEIHNQITRVGAGPVITFMDRVATPDRAVMNSIIRAADSHKIPWQYKRSAMGGTDAGAISRAVEGIPTAIIAIPCRNLHSPSSVISLDDYENTVKLLDCWLTDIGGIV